VAAVGCGREVRDSSGDVGVECSIRDVNHETVDNPDYIDTSNSSGKADLGTLLKQIGKLGSAESRIRRYYVVSVDVDVTIRDLTEKRSGEHVERAAFKWPDDSVSRQAAETSAIERAIPRLSRRRSRSTTCR
jgi:hypothetical protein